MKTAAVDRPRADRGQPAALLPDPAAEGRGPDPVRVQRPVEAVPEGHRRIRRPGGACARPVSSDDALQQGDRRNPGGRIPATETGWLRAGAENLALVSVEAADEPDTHADRQAGRTGEIQSALGPGLPAQGGIPAVLGICLGRLGGAVPGRMEHPHDAVEIGTDEEGGADAAATSGADSQLVPRTR